MPYYHATFRKHLESIYKHGLGGLQVEQNWIGCEPGVYLAEDPAVCIFIMLDQYVQFGDPTSVPKKHLDNIVILVIDDTRVNPRKFGPDPLINRKDVHLYSGVIDVRGMPALTIEQALPGQ